MYILFLFEIRYVWKNIINSRQDAQHFIQKICSSNGSGSSDIVNWRNFDQITTNLQKINKRTLDYAIDVYLTILVNYPN